MAEPNLLPHKLQLGERKSLTMTGATEVLRFDENAVVLATTLGRLTVHGQGLQLKNLSLEGGQVAVEGEICALVYEDSRPKNSRWRLLG